MHVNLGNYKSTISGAIHPRVYNLYLETDRRINKQIAGHPDYGILNGLEGLLNFDAIHHQDSIELMEQNLNLLHVFTNQTREFVNLQLSLNGVIIYWVDVYYRQDNTLSIRTLRVGLTKASKDKVKSYQRKIALIEFLR